MRRALILLLACLLLAVNAGAAEKLRPEAFRMATDSIARMYSRLTTVQNRLTLKKVLRTGDRLDFHFDHSLSDFPWREKDVDWFRSQLKKLLPSEYASCEIGKVFAKDTEIEDLVTPPLGIKGWPQPYAYASEDRNLRRLFVQQEGALRIPKGLSGRNIALWQSHGRYFDEGSGQWKWQRAPLHRTVEDMYTQSYVIPFLIPMLERAGAYVMTPRERDIQKYEVIIDNDPSFTGERVLPMRQAGIYNETGEWEDSGAGFADTAAVYMLDQNPFRAGTTRRTTCSQEPTSSATWSFRVPQRGSYAVYVAYRTEYNSSACAHYTVLHRGGRTGFVVNQKWGGGTWIYLGTFDFEGEGSVILDNGTPEGRDFVRGSVINADAVKIGGGMGKLERGGQTSGMAASAEGAHYWMQWAGADSTLTRAWETDYTCDYAARGAWTTMMHEEKDIPIDLALAFHSDAGVTPNDSIVGTLAIYTLRNDGKREFTDGRDRVISRVLCDYVQTQVVQDLRLDFDPKWSRRGLWDRSYSEPRTSGVPAMILELLSHQNFADMKYGLDPAFRFTACRAVYKGILKTLSEFYGSPYVVQPLPPKAFAARFEDSGRVRLDWEPTPDPKEPTADPDGYIVYTRIDDGAFDAGVECGSTTLTLDIEPGHIYSYKVVAFNAGGRSFPSEILSVGRPNGNQKAPVLIVNNFDRVAAPAWVESPGYAGFESRLDTGVPYLSEIGYIGENYEFRRSALYVDNDNPGFGASFDDHAGQIVAGNTFDYPFIHGQTLLRLGYPFYSMSRDAFIVNDTPAYVVDLICGKQARTPVGASGREERYPVFPKALTDAIRTAAEQGTNFLVSGANIASDNDEEAAAFAAEILGYTLANAFGTNTGCIADMPFSANLNEHVYCVERPDGLKPAGDGARIWLRYPGSPYAAAITRQAETYRTVCLGVPVETVLKAADREWILRQAMEFLYNDKRPARRR